MRHKQHKLRRARDIYAATEFYLGIGMTRTNYIKWIITFVAMAGILATQVNTVIGFELIPLKYAMIISLASIVGVIIFGWFDLKYLHITQKINEISTKYNPVIMRMYKRIKNISKNTRNRVIFH